MTGRPFKKGSTPWNKIALPEKEIISLYSGGENVETLSKKFNCFSANIYRVLERNNVNTSRKGKAAPWNIRRNLESNPMNNPLTRKKSSETKKRKYKEGLTTVWNKRNDLRENYEEIIKLYKDKLLSFREIGKKYNCTEIVIRQILKENGVIFNGPERMKLLYEKEKIRAWNDGLTKETDERVNNTSIKLTGRHLSEERRVKQGQTIKRLYCTGKIFGMKGKHHSNEAKEKIGRRVKNKKFEEIYGKERAKEIKENSRIRMLRDKNHQWLGGKSFEPYTPEFNKEFKNLVKLRDNFCCLNCGVSEQKHLILFGRKLTVHHVDYDKKNTCLINCCALCVNCNTLANKNRHEWTKYYQQKLSQFYNYKYENKEVIQNGFTRTLH